MVSAGKKRASPGAEEEKNPFEVDISEEVHEKLQKVSKEIARVELSLERQAQKKLVDVYQRRRDLVKTIPKFWPVALMNNVTFAMQAQHPDDQKALQHLTDVWVERHPVEPRAFTVEFHFSENPYFSNSVLKKVYEYNAPSSSTDDKPDEHGITLAMLDFDWERDVEAQVTKISWKDESKNLAKLHPRQLEDDGGVEEPGSFFNYFEIAEDAFELGHLVANEIFPEAIDWFTGQAADIDLDSDDESEEDDDDDDEGEIDLEKPRAKKQKHA